MNQSLSKKVFFIPFLLIVLTGKAQTLPQLYNEVKSSVVIVGILSVKTERMGNDKALVASASQGSGVLVSKEGLIWTAAHVVQSAELVKVEFFDGDSYDAEVLSSNARADVALLKIKGAFQLTNKKAVEIGNSDELQIGDDVFILGAPFGLKQSLSKGILSGKHILEDAYDGFMKVELLQTDAAINIGNSGGPMFNMKGEVVGITSSIFSHLGEFNGVGFAISSNVATKLLMEEPNLWTGMESVYVTGDLAAALNVPQNSGLLILNLSSKGVAGKLGLKGGTIPVIIDGYELIIGGDIILSFGGIKLGDPDFPALARLKLESSNKGEKIPITFLRNGKIEVIQFVKE